MVKLVYTPDLGSGALRREGSSPFIRTIYKKFNQKFIIVKKRIKSKLIVYSYFSKKNSIIFVIKYEDVIMDKSFMVFIAIGVGFLYFIINFVGDIQAEDDKYANQAYNKEHKYDMYKGEDSIGRPVLNLFDADAKTQVAAWNASKIKDEFISLFPDFEEMKKFASERVNGEPIRGKLLTQINKIEDQFFSGSVTAEQAKRALSTLK